VTADRDLGSAGPYPDRSGRWVARGRARVFYLDPRRAGQWFRLWRDLRRTPFDLVYVNSLFAPLYSLLPIAATWLGLIGARRVLIAPRGELCRGALALKARKKRLFLRWWAPVLRRTDVTWHAVTAKEAVDIRAVFPWARIEVNGNQSALPAEPMPAPCAAAPTARLVYIGRIDPKKNVDLVLAALRDLSTPVELDLYGPVADARYWTGCRALMDGLPPSVKVRYRGVLAPDAVRSAFAAYDAFVFPTRGENFGHAIAESLSASCPVICSDETPWSAVLRGGGGRVLPELTADALRAELERVAAMPPDDRLRARRRAGAAYRAWRAGISDRNVLEQVRCSATGVAR
jgi:glycosyltransferase involved in cell wall biosynthesis